MTKSVILSNESGISKLSLTWFSNRMWSAAIFKVINDWKLTLFFACMMEDRISVLQFTNAKNIPKSWRTKFSWDFITRYGKFATIITRSTLNWWSSVLLCRNFPWSNFAAIAIDEKGFVCLLGLKSHVKPLYFFFRLIVSLRSPLSITSNCIWI